MNSDNSLFVPGAGADKTSLCYDDDGLKRESSAPCQLACPAGIDIPSYIALIAQGNYQEAIDVIREDNPFPWVCGLICPNPCESWCQRRHLDKSLCIKDLKGLAAKMVMENKGYSIPKPEVKYPEKIAVIGSGPSGLTAAYFCAKQGYEVTIFEAFEKPGGMLVTGIPEYRLPRNIVQREIDAIQEMGVKIVLNTSIGTDISLDDLRKEGFKAFFLGIGAWQSSRLGIEGEKDYPQVIDVLTFLKDVSFGNKSKPGNNVAIVGGGNAAIDAARTCVRLGCNSVSILYRRTRSEMPAHFEEIIQAAEEAIHFHQLTIPVRLGGTSGKLEYIECAMATLADPDESGRRRPIPIPDSEYKMPVDVVISAIGQRPHVSNLPGLGQIQLSRKETVQVFSWTQQTSIPDVFAGGDAVTGPATVVQAIGAGKHAALGIHSYLRKLPIEKKIVSRPRRMVEPIRMDYREKAFIQRQEIPLINLHKRMSTFEQVELGLDEKSAQREARRCMRCDICERCGKCVDACNKVLNNAAITFFHAGENSLILKDYTHGLTDCIGCGTCVNACPTGALQMEDNGDERLLLMSGTVVNRLKLQECAMCGIHYAPVEYLKQLENKITDFPKISDVHLCPECRKKDLAMKMAWEDQDLLHTEESVHDIQ